MALGDCVLEDGALIEVLWQGQWMRGKLEYVWWSGKYRLCTGEWRLDVRAGMRARSLNPDPSPRGRRE